MPNYKKEIRTMKKNICFKLLLLILSVSMILPLLAACNGDSGQETSDTAAETSVESRETESHESEPSTETPTEDNSTEAHTQLPETEKPTEMTTEEPSETATEEPSEPETETGCNGVHEYEADATGHMKSECSHCGFKGEEKTAHTYKDGSCAVCGYTPECGFVHDWSYDDASHFKTECDKCGSAAVEAEPHVLTEIVEGSSYKYICEACETVFLTKEIGEGTIFMSPKLLSTVRTSLPHDLSGAITPSTQFNMGNTSFSIKGGAPCFEFSLGDKHESTTELIWNRNDPKYLSGTAEHQRYNFSIGKSRYLVIKIRTNDPDQSVQLLYGTAPDQKRTRFHMPMSLCKQDSWTTYILDLEKLYTTSHLATAETGEYDVDFLMFHIPSFSAETYIDLAYIAFVDGSWAELDALIDEEHAILVTAADNYRTVNVSDGSRFIPEYASAPTCDDGTLMLVTTESSASLLSPGTIVFECPTCGAKKSIESDAPIDPALLGMPIVYMEDLEDSLKPLTKLQKADGEMTVRYKYVSNSDDIQDFECACAIKIQGASSSGYVKKNFTVKFYTDETLEKKLKVDLGWGKENKYCMKANYIDSTQARNIVAAQMFAQMVAAREKITSGLEKAPNYGLIDGYPVLVYINGIYHGIYTMNIPKDDWQFAMEGDKTAKEALLMADAWTKPVALREQIGEFTDGRSWEDYGFELEYASDEANADWVRTSFNQLIGLLNSENPAGIRKLLPEHLDIEAAIDNMIFTYFIDAKDNRSKNILWATYDGEVWIPSMYDMDGTFGCYWNGQPIGTMKADGYPEDATHTYPYYDSKGNLKESGNKMWEVLINYFAEEVVERYTFLRKEILTVENTEATFSAFFGKTHDLAYISDIEKWDTESNGNKISYKYGDVTRYNMYSSTEYQLERMDEFFYGLIK